MFKILTGGYDHHVNNDYIKDRPHLEEVEEPASPNKLAETLEND